MKLHKVTFPEVSPSEWHKYFWDLLEVEPALVFGDAIGLCSEFPFVFEVADSTPIIMKPTPLAKQPREWVR